MHVCSLANVNLGMLLQDTAGNKPRSSFGCVYWLCSVAPDNVQADCGVAVDSNTHWTNPTAIMVFTALHLVFTVIRDTLIFRVSAVCTCS